MGNRNHNVFFSLHTVSGILASIALYVIFLAGAYTLFTVEISNWETQSYKRQPAKNAVSAPLSNFDFDAAFAEIEKTGIRLYARDIYLYKWGNDRFNIFLTGSKDSLAAAVDKESLTLQTDALPGGLRKSVTDTVGGILYGLHFFSQLGTPGYYLAGAVSMLFLFALISGVLLHWRKIGTNFYLFRPREKWKTVWTDAHTLTGVIGLPFQLMYALTGVFFCLGILVSIPGALLYGGDREAMQDDLQGGHHHSKPEGFISGPYRLNDLMGRAEASWPDFEADFVAVENYGCANMVFEVRGNILPVKKYIAPGVIAFDVKTRAVSEEDPPSSPRYAEAVSKMIEKLHFGNYGNLGTGTGYFLKMAYFLLAVLTCFVIMTGVLVWLEARIRKDIPEKEKRFNRTVGYSYLAICLSLFPVIPLSLIVSKLLPETLNPQRSMILECVFFGSWLLFSVVLFRRKDNFFTNRFTLLTGGWLSLSLPLISGWAGSTWPWNTFPAQHYDVFVMDMLWLMTAVVCLTAVRQIDNKRNSVSPRDT